MKKSLNDSLREEFNNILQEPEIKELIANQGLDFTIIIGAFDKLLAGEGFLEASEYEINQTRGEFENYILNHPKLSHN